MIQQAAIKARLVAQPRVGRVEPGGGLVLQSGILLVSQILVNPRQQLVRVEQSGVGLDGLRQLGLGAFEITALEQDASAIEMTL